MLSMLFATCFTKKPSSMSVCLIKHVTKQNEMCSDSVQAGTMIVPTSVMMSESSNTSEITLAKYRSTTASSSNLMSPLFHCVSQWSTHSETFKIELHPMPPQLCWSKRDPTTICVQGHVVLLALPRMMRKCQQKAMQKQHSLCLEILRQAPLTHPLKIRCSLREQQGRGDKQQNGGFFAMLWVKDGVWW